MNTVALFAGFWFACGITHYGFMVAYFTRQYPIESDPFLDRIFSALTAISGPIALGADLLTIWSFEDRPYGIFSQGWRL